MSVYMKKLFLLSLALFMASCAHMQGVTAPVDYSNPDAAGAIQRTVFDNMFDLTRCYQKQLETVPKLTATVVYQFKIKTNGRATEIHILDKRGLKANHPLSICVRKALASWSFPPDSSGKSERFIYPFMFRPTDGEDEK
jgi:hypothetical protein